MSSTMWRALIAVVLIAHGLGHAGGPWFFRRSWLLPAVTTGPTRWMFVVQWMAAGAGFVIAAIAVLGAGIDPVLWRGVAILAALLSGVVATLYVNWGPGRPLINAMIVDTFVLIALYAFDWPPASLVGA